MEMRGTQTGHRGQIFEGQQFMQMGMHGLDSYLIPDPVQKHIHDTQPMGTIAITSSHLTMRILRRWRTFCTHPPI